MQKMTATEARKKDAREKIELGGLIVTAGLRYEKRAVLLGLLIDAVSRRRIAQNLMSRTLHQIESITRNRFIFVVGPRTQHARFSVMIAQPYQLYVERTDRAKNMARYYAMSIDANLFGELCLTRRWGRIGSKGQTLIHHFEQEKDAVCLFLELTRQKRARGYRTRLAILSETDSCAQSTVVELATIR